jgi:hypothetical protein
MTKENQIDTIRLYSTDYIFCFGQVYLIIVGEENKISDELKVETHLIIINDDRVDQYGLRIIANKNTRLIFPTIDDLIKKDAVIRAKQTLLFKHIFPSLAEKNNFTESRNFEFCEIDKVLIAAIAWDHNDCLNKIKNITKNKMLADYIAMIQSISLSSEKLY